MPRKMTNGKTTLVVVEHIIIKNFWEYYVTDRESDNPDIKEALVIGFETELGDVYMPEIAPYIRTRTAKLEEIMAAPGWDWVD